MLPKGQREGSYVLRMLSFDVRFEDPFEGFKYGLQWPGSWELREEGGQSQVHDNNAWRLNCYLPGCVTALMSESYATPALQKGSSRGQKMLWGDSSIRWVDRLDDRKLYEFQLKFLFIVAIFHPLFMGENVKYNAHIEKYINQTPAKSPFR